MESPRSILIISGGSTFRKGFFNWERKPALSKKQQPSKCEVTRIILNAQALKKTFNESILLENTTFQGKQQYDMVIVADLLENMSVEGAVQILLPIQAKARNQVLVVVPELCGKVTTQLSTSLRNYHPTIFKNFDFTYLLLGREHENRVQLYSFYPNGANLAKTKNAPPAPSPAPSEKKPLKLAYILPDQDLTGGMKQLLLQAHEMHKKGHYISLYTKSTTAVKAIPLWSDLTEEDIDEQHTLKPEEDFLSTIGQVDAIILGWMEQVPQFYHAKTPVVLWEQGSSYIFGDFGTPTSSKSKQLAILRSYYRQPIHLAAVSPLVQTVLAARFGRYSHLVSAGVTQNTSSPIPEIAEKSALKQVLLVGDGQKEFKNFTFVIKALELALRKGEKFDIHWVTPAQPVRDMVPKGLRIEYHIAPSQEKLAMLYKSCDLLLSHSVYEAFSLPPLEAMAAGIAVLSIDNGGINTYAVSGENCLLYQQEDLDGYVEGIHTLLSDDALRTRLEIAGLATAQEFSVAAMCTSMESYLYQLL